MIEQLMTLCDDCRERMKEKYSFYPTGGTGKPCANCGRWPAQQYTYESKSAAYRRQNQQPAPSGRRDTRAYYRAPWREDEE